MALLLTMLGHMMTTTTTMRQVSEDASVALSRLPDFSFVVCFSVSVAGCLRVAVHVGDGEIEYLRLQVQVCDHATREGLPLIEYNAGKPLFPRGPRWPESRRGTWQARRSNPPRSRSRIAELLKPIYGDVEFTPAILSREDLPPPSPVSWSSTTRLRWTRRAPRSRCMKKLRTSSTSTRTRRRRITRCGTMNNGQCSRRPNWGGRRMLLAGLLSTISRLLRAADMDGRERESGERAK
jgi:hypothetical protein